MGMTGGKLRGRKMKSVCRGRAKFPCKTARKHCRWVSTRRRKYCRKNWRTYKFRPVTIL